MRCAVRGIQKRQARRQIRDGIGRYWILDNGGGLWLASPATLAEHFGVRVLSRPHQVLLADLCGSRGRRRAALAATVYRTDKRGILLSRRKVHELTGVAPSTQRRYENKYGHARVVDQAYAKLTRHDPDDEAGHPQRIHR